MKYLYLILLGLLALASATYAQTGNITVNGKIVDNNGEPLPGASVIEKGTTNGTIANFDGNFTLSVHSDASLVVSFIGFKTIEVTLGGKTELGSITLDSDIMELDQVVVIGYGTQRKVDLTGSVAVVNTEEMKKVSHSNISTMLEGRVAGIQITTDGQPGADPTVRIRGIGSF
ncbi:MAG TPA: SusC/RagA family protein, partial [Marinilabiliales bacterium]|nr:SusC/RagA family protein [Marinilabiliales bacterium]